MANYKRRRKGSRRGRRGNFGSMVMITVILTMILVVVSVKSKELSEKKDTYQKKANYLAAQIEEQNARSEEIEEYRKYMQTKQYIEDMAKEKLGLVNKDEIIFEADN